jgi:hypothetical protein
MTKTEMYQIALEALAEKIETEIFWRKYAEEEVKRLKAQLEEMKEKENA